MGGDMNWISRLFGRESYNHELYDRAPCGVCGGRGVIVASASVADPRSGLPRVRSCGGCRGKGYILVRKPADP